MFMNVVQPDEIDFRNEVEVGNGRKKHYLAVRRVVVDSCLRSSCFDALCSLPAALPKENNRAISVDDDITLVKWYKEPVIENYVLPLLK